MTKCRHRQLIYLFDKTTQLHSTLGIICTTEEIYSTVCWGICEKKNETNNGCRNRWHDMKMRHIYEIYSAQVETTFITALLDLTSFDSHIRDERRYCYIDVRNDSCCTYYGEDILWKYTDNAPAQPLITNTARAIIRDRHMSTARFIIVRKTFPNQQLSLRLDVLHFLQICNDSRLIHN
jgi:hypothetical protein